MPLSKEELVAIVQKYYDSSSIMPSDTSLSPERNRHHEIWEQWATNMGSWKTFKTALRSALPGYKVGEIYPSVDGGPRCLVYSPKESWLPESNWDVVGCISLLAPVYFVYGVEWDYVGGRGQNFRAHFDQPPPSMVSPAHIVASTIENIFGFSAVSLETAETFVPLLVGSIEPPKTTLFHALFTSEPSNIP